MDARIFALEGLIHHIGQQQLSMASLIERFVSRAGSLDSETVNIFNHWKKNAFQVEQSVLDLKLAHGEKDQSAIVEIHEIEPTPLATPPAKEIEELETLQTATSEKDIDQLAGDILDVIQRYSQHLIAATHDGEGGDGKWLGKHLFIGRVKAQIEKAQPIRLILPAFPWKSVNKVEKVTGVLPDFGEELALYRLNQMCEDIKTVYPLGGKVHIATDGLVFDDVVGISDDDTWAYGECLVSMSREHGLEHIRLMRVMDILGLTEGKILDRDLYMELAAKCRQAVLDNYGRTEDEVRRMMKDDEDTLMTYRGFICFLEQDLKWSPVTAESKAMSGTKYRKMVKKVAIQMMIRAESFTKLLQDRCVDYVRLSIHPSTGAVKLSFPLVVQGSGAFPRSPWHSSLALAVDGSYSTVPKREVRESHDLICKDGRGYYFREKSDVWDLSGGDEGEEVDIVPRYPNHLVVKPAKGELHGLQTLSAGQLHKLQILRASHTAGPVEAVGFTNAD